MVPELPGVGNQVNMVPEFPEFPELPGSETKSIWSRNFLGVGNQVNMVLNYLNWSLGGRKPSQYGSGIP